jgi:hypothetical protein
VKLVWPFRREHCQIPCRNSSQKNRYRGAITHLASSDISSELIEALQKDESDAGTIRQSDFRSLPAKSVFEVTVCQSRLLGIANGDIK